VRNSEQYAWSQWPARSTKAEMLHSNPVVRLQDKLQSLHQPLSACLSALHTAAAPRDVFAPSQPQGQYKFKAIVMQLQVRTRPGWYPRATTVVDAVSRQAPACPEIACQHACSGWV
jgi:hypothetical protein